VRNLAVLVCHYVDCHIAPFFLPFDTDTHTSIAYVKAVSYTLESSAMIEWHTLSQLQEIQ